MEELSKKLKTAGVEAESVINRLGGNEAVYLSICRKFLMDSNYQLFCTSMDNNDLTSAKTYIHTLKGVAANLGFLRMELICNEILEDLRNNNVSFLKQYQSDLSEEYKSIITVLRTEAGTDNIRV
jgi:HPt (histidine-containing phosphotransfer) domain-containing protein